MDWHRMILRVIEPIQRRILLMISRAVIKQIYDDKGVQAVKFQGLVDEVRDRVERFQDFGLTSSPPVDSDAIVIFPGGDRSRGVVISVEDRATREKNLAAGETCLYNAHGQKVFLKNGSIHVGSRESDNPVVLGNEIKALLQDLLTEISTHTHMGNLGFPTGPPMNAGEFQSLKASPVDDDAILSDVVFTEKGE